MSNSGLSSIELSRRAWCCWLTFALHIPYRITCQTLNLPRNKSIQESPKVKDTSNGIANFEQHRCSGITNSASRRPIGLKDMSTVIECNQLNEDDLHCIATLGQDDLHLVHFMHFFQSTAALLANFLVNKLHHTKPLKVGIANARVYNCTTCSSSHQPITQTGLSALPMHIVDGRL